MGKELLFMNTPVTVLVIDDDEAVRLSLNVHFEDNGFSVHTAASAEESLIIMEKKSIDISVIDLRLPVMNGMDLIREAHSRWPSMGFIIHTGSVEYDFAEDVVTLPQVSNTICIKPVADLSVFCREIDRLMEGMEVSHDQ